MPSYRSNYKPRPRQQDIITRTIMENAKLTNSFGRNPRAAEQEDALRAAVETKQMFRKPQPVQEGVTLYGGYPIDPIAYAVAMRESSGGKNIGPRYEPGFEKRYGPTYMKRYPDLFNKYSPQELYSSYGRYQIMYPVAVELGYRGSPADLAKEDINRLYFEKKFQRDWKSSGGDLDKAFLRYNGGGNPDYPAGVRRYLPPLEER